MKLLRLKLLSKFRGLHEGFEIKFRDNNLPSNKEITPLCFVGLNGSGKSNLLEVLCEIFYYIERYALANETERKSMNHTFGFEIDLKPSNEEITNNGLSYLVSEFVSETELILIENIRIVKKLNALPEFIIVTVNQDEKVFPNFVRDDGKLGLSYENTSSFLPKNIIGYSSGQNELISNPFIKMDFHYFEEYEKQVKNKIFSKIDINRLFYMDYESNKMVVLANYLIPDEKTYRLKTINTEIGVEDLKTFSITIKFSDVYKKEIELPNELRSAVEKLKSCSTTFFDEGEGNKRALRLDFYVDKAVKEAFRFHFKTAFELYRYLYLLRLLNIHKFRRELRKSVMKAGAGESNLSAMIPKLEQESLAFAVDDIAFTKKHVNDLVYYRQLSDGEHQLLHVLGTILLMGTTGNLFILDEPETHFNPEWRSKFVNLLNQCVTQKIENTTALPETYEQDFLITSHSPFIISDCKRENVFIFFRAKKNKVEYRQLENETYGASVSVLLDEVFGKKETISDKALSELEGLRTRVKKLEDIATVKTEAQRFGDSIEKMLLYNFLIEKEKEFKKKMAGNKQVKAKIKTNKNILSPSLKRSKLAATKKPGRKKLFTDYRTKRKEERGSTRKRIIKRKAAKSKVTLKKVIKKKSGRLK